MNEYAKKLVAALRSGKYAQGQHRLRIDDAYCCLGVACDLVKDEIGAKWEANDFGTYAFLGEDNKLPEEVMKLYRFRTPSGQYYTGFLSRLNDQGSTFDEIADIIESEPEGLFCE